MNKPRWRLVVTAVIVTATIALGGLTSITSSASAATSPPATGTTVTSTLFGDRVYTTYEKTGVLRVIIGPHRLSRAELNATGPDPSPVIPASDVNCGGGSLTYACLEVLGSGLYVEEMYCEGGNTSSSTVNMDVRLYWPPPSAFKLFAATGYHLVPAGDYMDIDWWPESNQPAGTYSCTSWVGGQGVNSLGQVTVVP